MQQTPPNKLLLLMVTVGLLAVVAFAVWTVVAKEKKDAPADHAATNPNAANPNPPQPNPPAPTPAKVDNDDFQLDSESTSNFHSAEFSDPAFDRFIDLATIQQAVAGRDPATVLDAALLTAAGEQALFRPRGGVSADKLLALSVRFATDSRDQAVLERLARVAEARQDKALQKALAAAALAGPSRSIGAGPDLNTEGLEPQLAAFIQSCLNGISQARSLGDREALDQLEAALPEMKHLNDAQRAALKKRMTDARDSMPPKAEAELLASLTSNSRGGISVGGFKTDWPPSWGAPNPGGAKPPTPPYIETDHGLWFRNGTTKTMYLCVRYNVPESSRPDYTPPQNIVSGWITIAPGQRAQAVSGDLKNRYYAYYAEGGGLRWQGNLSYLVHGKVTARFGYDLLNQRQVNGLSRSIYVYRGFRTIDTGATAKGFVQNLTP